MIFFFSLKSDYLKSRQQDHIAEGSPFVDVTVLYIALLSSGHTDLLLCSCLTVKFPSFGLDATLILDTYLLLK